MKTVKKRVLRVLPYALAGIIVGVGVLYVWSIQDQFRQLSVVSWRNVILVVVTSCVGVGISGHIIRLLMSHFHIKLGFWESVSLVLVSLMGAYLIPAVGGMGAKAAYLKTRYGFPLTKFLSVVAVSVLIMVSVNSLAGMVALGLLYLHKGVAILPAVLILSMVFVCSVGVMLIPVNLVPGRLLRFGKVKEFFAAWNSLSKSGWLLRRLFFWNVCLILVTIVNLDLSLASFHPLTGIVDAAIISSLDTLTFLVSFTPERIGISEGVILVVSGAIGYPPAEVLAGAVLRRLVSMLVGFGGGALSAFYLSRSAADSGLERK